LGVLGLARTAEAAPCQAGSKAKVKWERWYYQATVKTMSGSKACIRYDGWSSSYDECVAPRRIKCTGKKLPFKSGTRRVEVEWKKKYYPVKIKSVRGGKYCITYKGFGKSWDECVGPRRVRQAF
jgi:hypothetical protein